MVGPGIGATYRHNLSYRIRRIRYRQKTRNRLPPISYRHVALPPKKYRHNLSYRIRHIQYRQLSYRQKSTVNSHTAKKVRQYWIPPRKYRQHWIPPKKYRQTGYRSKGTVNTGYRPKGTANTGYRPKGTGFSFWFSCFHLQHHIVGSYSYPLVKCVLL